MTEYASMTAEELRIEIARAKGIAERGHLSPQWSEGSTSDGQDGWDGFYCPRCGKSGSPDKGYSDSLCAPNWPTLIAAAWELFEEMGEGGAFPEVQYAPSENDERPLYYWITLVNPVREFPAVDTAPRAICLAWLAWKGV